jgi:hypothetical protein
MIMINKMRLIFVTVTALCLLPGLASADGRFSFRLQGGWTYILGGDVNRGTKAFFDPGAWEVSSGGYRGVHGGYEFGGDIIFALTPRLGIGIGGGYVQISRYSQMSLLPGFPSWYHGLISSDTKLSAIPIRAGVYLNLPWRGKFNILADLGLSYYFKSAYNNESMRLFFSDGDTYSFLIITTRAENKEFPIGFNAGISLEYELGHNYYLFLGVQTRYARFRGWTGRSMLLDNSEPPLSEYEGGKLYYEVVPELAGAPRLLVVQESPPDGPGGEPRQAAIDFSGVSLQFGIRIRL